MTAESPVRQGKQRIAWAWASSRGSLDNPSTPMYQYAVALTAADRLEIREVIALPGQLCDARTTEGWRIVHRKSPPPAPPPRPSPRQG